MPFVMINPAQVLKHHGFTLMEIVILLMIIGVLSAISAPSFIHQLNRIRVEDALLRVHGALRETQSEAIRRSRTCSITIPRGVDQTITGDCLITGDRPLKMVELLHNRSESQPNWQISFDYKGRNQNYGEQGTLVIVPASKSSVTPKCLVISVGIGLMRIGSYDGNIESILAESCVSL